jgi:hypothetical protein
MSKQMNALATKPKRPWKIEDAARLLFKAIEAKGYLDRHSGVDSIVVTDRYVSLKYCDDSIGTIAEWQ